MEYLFGYGTEYYDADVIEDQSLILIAATLSHFGVDDMYIPG